MKMEEKWKDIEGYNGVYQISNIGRVKSFKRSNPSILTPTPNSRGYFCVLLCIKGKHKSFTIHRLVASYFINKRDGDTEVNHIDFDKANNTVINLEWCTPKENIKHAMDGGRFRFLAKKHPSLSCYRQGCRCNDCKILNKEQSKKYREIKKNITPSPPLN